MRWAGQISFDQKTLFPEWHNRTTKNVFCQWFSVSIGLFFRLTQRNTPCGCLVDPFVKFEKIGYSRPTYVTTHLQ